MPAASVCPSCLLPADRLGARSFLPPSLVVILPLTENVRQDNGLRRVFLLLAGLFSPCQRARPCGNSLFPRRAIARIFVDQPSLGLVGADRQEAADG